MDTLLSILCCCGFALLVSSLAPVLLSFRVRLVAGGITEHGHMVICVTAVCQTAVNCSECLAPQCCRTLHCIPKMHSAGLCPLCDIEGEQALPANTKRVHAIFTCAEFTGTKW